MGLESINSSMYMPNYNYGLYGLGDSAAYNFNTLTSPLMYTGGFNPIFGYNNYANPTLPFSYNGLSTTQSTPVFKAPRSSSKSKESTESSSNKKSDEKTPKTETKEGRSVWGKIGIGLLITAAVVGIGLGADYKWNNSKCRKAIGDWFKCLGKAKPEKKSTPETS